MKDNTKNILYNISRVIENDTRNKYLFFASKFNKNNYRVITNAELAIRGKDLELPFYVRDFIKDNSEVILICNNIKDNTNGILLRSVYKKEFCNYGFGKGMFYGIGDLTPDFKYGDVIVLVEGAIDRDVCATFITKNCLAVLTSQMSNNQVEFIKRLTNRIILLMDNDEAGIKGENSIIRKLKGSGINVYQIPKSPRIKDLGDLIDLLRFDIYNFNDIINMYRTNISVYGGVLNANTPV